MNITELMVGDIVTDLQGHIIVVEHINEKVSVLNKSIEKRYEISADRLKPLPIKDSWLVHNGWEYVYKNVDGYEDYGVYCHKLHRFEYDYSQCLLTFMGHILPMTLQYTHELQHIFKLFGFTDEANYFEVKFNRLQPFI